MQPPARCNYHRCVYIDQCDNSVTNVRKKMHKNNNRDLINMVAYIKFGENFLLFFLNCKILFKNEILNEILTSVKGHNSVTDKRKMMRINPNIDLVNINAYIKFCEILSTCSQDIERKRNSDVNQGP